MRTCSLLSYPFKGSFLADGRSVQPKTRLPFLLWVMWAYLSVSPAPGQSLPKLPGGYLENLSFHLASDADPRDSLAFDTTMKALASQVREQIRSVADRYALVDTNALVQLANARLLTAFALADYPQVLVAVRDLRAYQPSPAYVMPPGLIQAAFASAQLDRKNLASSLRSALLTLPEAFRTDQINILKGMYSAGTQTTYRQRLDRVVAQAVRLGGVLSLSNALAMLDTYLGYRFRLGYGPVLEKILYEYAPSRVEERELMIPMRDSARLSGLLFRHLDSAERVPAILIFGPYREGTEAVRGYVFTGHGYALVYADCRGQYKSDGQFFPFENDARDLYDVIDWVSRQPWCNGQVATYGGSYLGWVQWQAIRQGYRHPALRAMNPTASVGLGIDFPQRFGLFPSYVLRWADAVSGKQFNRIRFNDLRFWDQQFYQWYYARQPFDRLDSAAGLSNPYFQKWMQHPDLDDYWKRHLPSPQDYAALNIPVLTITGYFDADQPGALHYYEEHQRWGQPAGKSRHFLLIGPYDHFGTQWMPAIVQGHFNERVSIESGAQIPIYQYTLQWFDWVLKGKAKPAFLRGSVTYFATGTGRWQGAASFKAATQDTLRLFLSPVKRPTRQRKERYALDRTPPRSSRTLVYRHDVASVLDSAYLAAENRLPTGGAVDDAYYLTATHHLIFESQPLLRDILLTDKIVPRLWMSLNVPDADFVVNAYEVTPEGRSRLLAKSFLRTRYRLSQETPQLMEPGRVEELIFSNHHLYVRRLRRGSRLRLTFAVNNSPYWEKNYGFGGVVSRESSSEPRVIEATLHVGPHHPSRLELPYARPGK